MEVIILGLLLLWPNTASSLVSLSSLFSQIISARSRASLRGTNQSLHNLNNHRASQRRLDAAASFSADQRKQLRAARQLRTNRNQ